MFDLWEECRDFTLSVCNVEHVHEDKLYKIGNIPENINVGEAVKRIKESFPHNIPINSPGLDNLYKHFSGPSLAMITEISGPRGIGKTLYW